MNGSTRSLSSSLVVVTFLGIILVSSPGGPGIPQSEERTIVHGFERSPLSSERMLADMQTLSGPSFNGRRPDQRMISARLIG